MQKAGHPNLFFGSEADVALQNCFDANVQKHKGKYAYQHKGAAYFELWDDFDRMKRKCYEKETLLGIRNWTMVFLMFALLLRYFDNTNLQEEIPKGNGNMVLDKDGYPRFLYIFLPRSKGISFISAGSGSNSAKGYLFQLMRNYKDRSLCPGVVLWNYLLVSGISSGPLFPQFIE